MRTGLAAIALALLATGCSSSDDTDAADNGSGAETGSSVPACSDVWVNGQTLPEDYEGCMNGDDSMEAAVILECDSGIGSFAAYQDEFFALLGGEITEAPSDSDEYAAAYEECFADG